MVLDITLVNNTVCHDLILSYIFEVKFLSVKYTTNEINLEITKCNQVYNL